MSAIQHRVSKTILPLMVIAFMLVLPLVAFAQSNDSGGVFGALFASATSLICCVAWFIINIAILIWVYQDANKRGANGVLWAIIVFIAGLLGLLLYFAVGRNNNSTTA